MVHVSKHNAYEFLIGARDLKELIELQSMMDGRKVRMKNQIIVPRRSITKLIDYGIEYTPETDEVKTDINLIRSEIAVRETNISKIKESYNSDIKKYDYNYVGPYGDLMKHQKIMYQMMMFNNSSAILGEPGTGKTLAFLAAIDQLIKTGKIKKALIITLSPLKDNVILEMEKQVPHLSGVSLKGGSERIGKILNKGFSKASANRDYDIYVANYESMFSMVDVFADDYFDLVILDEAHRISSPKSRQSKVIIEKFENIKRKYISTGTLVSNDIMSFFMPYRFLGPDTVPYANYYEFRGNFMRAVDRDGHIWRALPGSNEKVRNIIGKSAVLFTKDQCLDLPGLLIKSEYCDMSPEQEKFYNALKTDLVADVKLMCDACSEKVKCGSNSICCNDVFVKNALVLSQKLQQIASGFYIDSKVSIDDEGKEIRTREVVKFEKIPKLDLMIDVLDTMPNDKKVIIWSHFVPAIEIVADKIRRVFGQESVMTCYGDDDAFKSVMEFKDNKKRFIVANPFKMGVGQNMQYSTYQLFYTNSYSYVMRDQAICRQYRAGQSSKVTVIDLISRATIDEDVVASLLEKQDLSINLTSLAKIIK